jgi:hypothetical protein
MEFNEEPISLHLFNQVAPFFTVRRRRQQQQQQ